MMMYVPVDLVNSLFHIFRRKREERIGYTPTPGIWNLSIPII